MPLFSAVIFLWLIFKYSYFLLTPLYFNFCSHTCTFDKRCTYFYIIATNEKHFIKGNSFFRICVYFFYVNCLSFCYFYLFTTCFDNCIHSFLHLLVYSDSPYRHPSMSLKPVLCGCSTGATIVQH